MKEEVSPRVSPAIPGPGIIPDKVFMLIIESLAHPVSD
jgi:hypothetical protein